MREGKWTPGPWTIVEYGDDIEDAGHPLAIHHSDSDRVCFMATPGSSPKSSPIIWANARLIAAAPDLLEALKDLHADCVEYARINNLHNSDGSPATNHAMRRALAAIAKAEGHAALTSATGDET